ncbi:hypothetical protein X797_005585 [Metarhizium robertsii]|uniref:Uncharacterized protein n=1 Tax=Metarhizium robertsii TaxID=568076 RepID=A0A014PBU5_9HYPO|nr:hypothetical protein X797_005585 [Metarhizium robertsii]
MFHAQEKTGQTGPRIARSGVVPYGQQKCRHWAMVEELDVMLFGCDAGKAGRYCYSPSERRFCGRAHWPTETERIGERDSYIRGVAVEYGLTNEPFLHQTATPGEVYFGRNAIL